MNKTPNWDKIIREIPQKKQDELVAAKQLNWKPHLGEGRDGFIQTWKKEFIHKNIPFDIIILRYYSFGRGFIPMSRRKTSRHVVVEHPQRIKKFVERINALNVGYDFLYHDTLHEWNEKQKLIQQLNEAYAYAITDINLLEANIEHTEKAAKENYEDTLEGLNKLKTAITRNKEVKS